MRVFSLFFIIITLSACNSVYTKPGTLDKNDVIYVDRGGYQMQHEIKNLLEKRGYNVTVGYKKNVVGSTRIESEDSESVISKSPDNHARYIVSIRERTPRFNPFWCPFNGFWLWRYSVSIADNKTGQEILGWAGRGCANSSLRKLDKILDELEVKDNGFTD